MNFRRPRSVVRNEIDPDEIFLDSENLPGFDVHQFEGRLERPVSVASMIGLSIGCLLILLLLLSRVWILQGQDGQAYAAMSDDNMLRETVIFPQRGAIFDRNGVKLAWNAIPKNATSTTFLPRAYTSDPGFGHVLGYVKYPAKDSYGHYYRPDFVGMAGVEKYYDNVLDGEQGLKIVETDALGKTQSESVIKPAKDGENLTLSIDSGIQKELYSQIKALADRVGFRGGAGVIMNVHTGEIIALTNYPEYESQIMSDGTDVSAIEGYLHDKREPFLDRITEGLYTPGSIVKPYVAVGALEEHVIDPNKKILSTGSISIPNPYDPTRKSVFMDWRPQGWIDIRHAIAVSSDVYFYEVGGGFQDQPGLGIERLDKYFNLFGLGENDMTGFFGGPKGTVPSPAWKGIAFPGDPWRIGDTYFTAIGQYGFQVTPLQMIRSIAAVANGGTYLYPTILKANASSTSPIDRQIPVDPANLEIVREGMRDGVLMGTGTGLNVPYVEVASKTGTAQLGVSKDFENSWATGFWPYQDPQYAYLVVMEHGPSGNVFGGVYVMRQLLDWMHQNEPQYLSDPALHNGSNP